jgi:hypothetical protein
MGAAFDAAAARVYLYLSDNEYDPSFGSRFVTIDSAPCDDPPPDSIVLCHFSDRLLLDQVKHDLVVFYGGSGGADWTAAGERIWRPVSAAKGTLSPSDATKLLVFASVSSVERDRERPEFLRPPARNEALNAIAILCQGYLAARTIAAGPAIRTDSVTDALVLMRWPENAELLLSAGDNLRKVRAGAEHVLWRRWWMLPLEHLPMPLVHSVVREWGDEELICDRLDHPVNGTAITCEKPKHLPVEMVELLKWLVSRDETQVTDEVVANAFRKVAARLGGSVGS